MIDLNLRWQPWSKVTTCLSPLNTSQHRLLFIANPGNAGDALIASATWQLFEDLGLRPMQARARDIRRGDNVIYGGGGNLIPLYSDAQKAMETSLRVGVTRFVLLPHTIRGHEELLSSLDQRFTLFGRDEVTMQHLAAHACGALRDAAPDMALGIDAERLQRRVATLPWWWTWRWAGLHSNKRARYQRWQRLSSLLQPDAHGHLEVYRSDQEAAHERGPAERDLSGLYCSALHNRDECDAVSAQFLNIIGRASSVSTDRLHVAIGANALHRQVRLFDNSYGKNHGVIRAFPALGPYVRLGQLNTCRT